MFKTRKISTIKYEKYKQELNKNAGEMSLKNNVLNLTVTNAIFASFYKIKIFMTPLKSHI